MDFKDNIEITQVAISELKPNPWNPNQVSAENELKIEANLREYGFWKPIIARESDDARLEIIGGQHRWEAAARLGYTTVPVVNLGRIKEEVAKTIALADNARFGADESNLLAAVLADIGTPEEIELVLPYSTSELDAIFKASQVDLSALDIDDDALPPESKSQLPAAGPTHATMKFRVRLADQDRVAKILKKIIKDQGFTKDTDEINAGDALTWLAVQFEETLA